MTDNEQEIIAARFEYMSLLRGGLREWLVDDEENTYIIAITDAIQDYKLFLAKKLKQN